MLPKLLFICMLSSFIFTQFCMSQQCVDHQKNLLLQLKHELIFNSTLSTKLVQWDHTNNCCHWHGVECDGAGNVISLQLDGESISGGIGDSSTLFSLNYLENLNLAYNYFKNSLIPKGIGNLTYLTHLNLSYAGFGGQVPLEISWLRRLVSLDISIDDYRHMYIEPLKLEYPNLETLIQNLPGLTSLYLDGVNITSFDERAKWSPIISSYLPNITALSLAKCSLSGTLARSFGKLHSLSVLRLDDNNLSTVNPNVFANFPRLTTLSLVACNLKGSFPKKVFQIPTLQYLALSYNEELSGGMPPFPQNGTLKSIRLTFTNFSGFIPTSIGDLKSLSVIDLYNCRFTGTIPSTFANLTQLTDVYLSYNFFIGSFSSTMFERFSSLVNLDLESNSFTGNIPDSLFPLPSLETINLHNNKFIGTIPEFSTINVVSKILNLYLSNNQLQGPIPDSFFQLHSLEILALNENLLSGTFQLDKIQSLANLTFLDLSGNNLSLQVSNDNSTTYGLPKLKYLILPSCNLHDFPHFIKHSHDMDELDLSNNRIGGEIPSWIWGTQLRSLNLSFNLLTHVQKPYHIPYSLGSLDLQSNQLREELHLLFPPNLPLDLRYLSLRNNSLSGSIPTSLCTAAYLFTLGLSMNKLSGTIPSCLGTMSELRVLDLGRNNISGHIPDNFTLSCEMTYFDVNNNTIQGNIPKSMERCKWLELINVGNNIINDTFPCMLSSTLKVLVLRANRFHGEVKCYNNNSWEELQIIDISRNNFSGSLQSLNFSTWRAMVVGLDGQFRGKNLMVRKVGIRLTMKGLEVELDKIYRDFTSIDFSCNNFRGEIPHAIGDLISLRLLNFSHNALDGRIPKSFGKLRELESLDLSHNKLTGHIPMELSRPNFLSVLNLSYNELVGEIPKGKQLQTFSADSFIGNPGLCGFNLNKSCTSPTEDESDENNKQKKKKKKMEIEWEYVSAALGYAVGLGSFVWLLLFCRSFRVNYFGKIDEVVEEIFDARDRRRRTLARRRLVKNRQIRRR